jgi:hypothetical protein
MISLLRLDHISAYHDIAIIDCSNREPESTISTKIDVRHGVHGTGIFDVLPW